MDKDINELIAEAVIDILADRAGFDDWWYDIDDDIQAEIMEDLEAEIESILQAFE